MTIQRQYSLPNCQLVVEGLGQDASMGDMTGRPLLSIVTHMECRFAGQEKPLQGGRDLLESLMTAVSEYAQEYLSGVSHPAAHPRQRNKPRLVQLQKVDSNLHRLTVQPLVNNDTKSDATITPGQLDLTTVQLFDLVEAVDQLFADAQTVPDISLKLAPLPKRLAVSQEPVAKRAIAPAIGVSGLALAAAAMFLVPPPPKPAEPTADAGTTETIASPSPDASPGASPGASPDVSPSPATSPIASPSPVAASPETSPVVSPSPDTSLATSATTTPTADGQTSGSQELDAILRTSPEITDQAELDRLTATLQDNLYAAWQKKPAPTFTKDLEFQVGVGQNGDVLGFKFANDEALNYVNEIPLSDVQYQPTGETQTSRESIARFRVVFKPNGILEISPWHGLAPGESAPSP